MSLDNPEIVDYIPLNKIKKIKIKTLKKGVNVGMLLTDIQSTETRRNIVMPMTGTLRIETSCMWGYLHENQCNTECYTTIHTALKYGIGSGLSLALVSMSVSLHVT